jgi:hypothetical protein
MNTPNEMAGILEQWTRLTQAEGTAIQAAAWPALKQIQSQKAGLRKAFSQAAAKFSQEEAAAGPGGPASKPFRVEVSRLLALVARNGAVLAAQLSRARSRQELLDQANRNLRRIQSSYVRPQRAAAWHSYS